MAQYQFDHATFVHAASVRATFVHATFAHATSVRATFVHATSVCATFFHTTFVQGQILVVYKCNHSCLDETIEFQTSYKAKPKLGQLQLMMRLALGTAQTQLVVVIVTEKTKSIPDPAN